LVESLASFPKEKIGMDKAPSANGNGRRRGQATKLTPLREDVVEEINVFRGQAADLTGAIDGFLSKHYAALSEASLRKELAAGQEAISDKLLQAFENFVEGLNSPERVLRVGEMETAFENAVKEKARLKGIETKYDAQIKEIVDSGDLFGEGVAKVLSNLTAPAPAPAEPETAPDPEPSPPPEHDDEEPADEK
jgi:hypothetical protein